jgi:aryl-alcohol dehydrogenase-like predicted oxidoreductase
VAVPSHAAYVVLRLNHESTLTPTEYAIHNRLTPFISMQNHHSASYREEEREMMPTLKYFGVGVIPWSPLAGGCELIISDREAL